MEDADPQELPLREALIRWCDERLVEQVRARERQFTAADLVGFHRARLVPDAALRQPSRQEWMIGPPDFAPLIGAWQTLECDFGDRLRRGEFHLHGVQTKPERTTEPRPIPSAWAADCQFDFTDNTVTIDDQRFVAVVASRAPLQPVLPEAVSEGRRPAGIRPDTIGDLTDEEVLLLLEEHGRRVIAAPDAKLISPGKISLLPIVAGKLRHRADHGEMLDTIAAEARWLAEWIASKVSLHQVPTAGTIGKMLGTEYKLLKARSNAAIQTLKG